MSSERSHQAQLVLVRHGQGSLGTDNYDRLSPTGWVQSELLGEHLREHVVPEPLLFCGKLERHKQTLQGLKLASEATLDEALNEYTVDKLIGAALEQASQLNLEVLKPSAFENPKAYLETFLAWFPTVLMHWQEERLTCPHNGPWQDFHARVCSPLDQWQQCLMSGQSVLAVTSAGVISTLVAHALGHTLDWQRECNVCLYNASITRLSINADGHWQLNELNDIAHLTRPELHTLA